MSDISNVVSSMQKIMWKDAWVDGDAQRIGQLSWMLFLKIFDAREKELEILQKGYKSILPDWLRWRDWAEDDEWITWDALIDFVNNKLLPELKKIHTSDDRPMTYIIRNVFEDTNNYMKSWTLMRQVINKLDEIDFNKKEELHIFNDIYEKILNDLQSAGNAWEFYTPRAVTHFIVEMVDPKLWETVIDPACWTGWFLTATIDYVRKYYVKSPDDEHLLSESIYWWELKQLPHLLATTNLILHGIEVPKNLRHGDSLARPLKDIWPKDQKDIVVMNPPFGWHIEDGIIHNFPSRFQTTETFSLFVLLIINLLKNWWRAWIVLPDGFLFGEWIGARIREELLTKCNLHTIIRLPNNVFAPYANVATNLLFFTKWETTKEVWFYEHKVPEWQKTYNKSNPIKLGEFDKERVRWNNRVENSVSWKVSIDQIKERDRNLDRKNPNTVIEEEVLDTGEIISKIEHNLDESRSILSQLKQNL